MFRSLLALFVTGVLTAGCSTIRMVDSEVQSFSTLVALPTQAAYRFDRLPSQQAQNQRMAELESMAEQALSKVGLRRNEANAQYAVQVGARVKREDVADWSDFWWHGGLPGPHFSHFRPWSSWSSPWLHTTPWFQREISLTVRDLQTGQVVFETHAAQEGSWSDSGVIFPAMFAAALSEFPANRPGVRKINIELPPP